MFQGQTSIVSAIVVRPLARFLIHSFGGFSTCAGKEIPTVSAGRGPQANCASLKNSRLDVGEDAPQLALLRSAGRSARQV
ncbi:MAG: hypothetical protein ACM3OF_00575 [Gemmatimonas sp.]